MRNPLGFRILFIAARVPDCVGVGGSSLSVTELGHVIIYISMRDGVLYIGTVLACLQVLPKPAAQHT